EGKQEQGQREDKGSPQPVRSSEFLIPRRRAGLLICTEGDPSEKGETG
ncbi:hypothetical protein A2U01_0117173, partial [Trifolium medium]|nr:hypothetical protein [Trifolium medium]